jgi:hypothetical protein
VIRFLFLNEGRRIVPVRDMVPPRGIIHVVWCIEHDAGPCQCMRIGAKEQSW